MILLTEPITVYKIDSGLGFRGDASGEIVSTLILKFGEEAASGMR